MSGKDQDEFKFENLRSKFVNMQQPVSKNILKTPPKPQKVLMRIESTRTPPEGRRGFREKDYRDLISSSLSEDSSSEYDTSIRGNPNIIGSRQLKTADSKHSRQHEFAEDEIDDREDKSSRNSFDSFESSDEDNEKFKENLKRISHSSRVIQELLETELNYVANLKRGIEEYISPYDSVSLPSALVGKKKILFSNIEIIHRLHESKFLPSLLECGDDPEKVADVFSTFIDGFELDIYIIYALNRTKSDKLCREHEDFFKGIQKDQLGIGSFLIRPIQRLPRYEMLLAAIVKDLMKDLDGNKPAIAACCRAEKHIQRLLNQMNEHLP